MAETLEDVKAGDTVTLIWRGEPLDVVVERVTATQIITTGNSRYRRQTKGYVKAGEEVGGHYRSHRYILVGDEAKQKRIDHELEISKRNACVEFARGLAKAAYTQEGIIALRIACDNAEAALRQFGEWVEAIDAVEKRT